MNNVLPTDFISFLLRPLSAGLSYGFANYLACWIDTNKDNFPPPLSWELLEPLFALVGKMEPSLAHLMWEQMLCHRLGCQNLTTVQVCFVCLFFPFHASYRVIVGESYRVDFPFPFSLLLWSFLHFMSIFFSFFAYDRSPSPA